MPTITKSIGTATRDYSTITAHEADLDNGAVYSSGDDAVGECYDDSVFDESVTINGGGTVGLASVTLTVAEGERHDGTAGTGARIVRTSDWDFLITAARPVTVEWIECDVNARRVNSRLLVASNAVTHPVLRNLIVHGVVQVGLGHNPRIFCTNVSPNPAEITNNIVYALLFNINAATVTQAIATTNFGGAHQRNVMNNTVHDIAHNGTGSVTGILNINNNAAEKVQNNIVTDVGGTTSGTKACFSPSSPSTATVDHNASSDTTASGTGSLTEIVTADQYVSTVVGSEDLHLKAGSVCIDAGTDLGTSPAGVNIDIDGQDRTGLNWAIGADQPVASFVPAVAARSSQIIGGGIV